MRFEDSAVKVLWLGYLIPFHHFPPVSWESLEFPPYGLGSVRACALQEEVDKMVEKGTMELVDQTCLGFYIRLFLLRMTTGVCGIL